MLRHVNELKELSEHKESAFIIITHGHYEKLRREHPEFAKRFDVVLDRAWTSAINPKRQKRLLLLKTKRV